MTAKRLIEALEDAAQALEDTAAFVARLDGPFDGTARGIRADARKARAAIAKTSPPATEATGDARLIEALRRTSLTLYRIGVAAAGHGEFADAYPDLIEDVKNAIIALEPLQDITQEAVSPPTPEASPTAPKWHDGTNPPIER